MDTLKEPEPLLPEAEQSTAAASFCSSVRPLCRFLPAAALPAVDAVPVERQEQAAQPEQGGIRCGQRRFAAAAPIAAAAWARFAAAPPEAACGAGAEHGWILLLRTEQR